MSKPTVGKTFKPRALNLKPLEEQVVIEGEDVRVRFSVFEQVPLSLVDRQKGRGKDELVIATDIGKCRVVEKVSQKMWRAVKHGVQAPKLAMVRDMVATAKRFYRNNGIRWPYDF